MELKPDYNATAVEVDNAETCTTQDELLAVIYTIKSKDN
jgi:hypothetical protein